MAASLATIASQLATRIFTPFYKPAASDDIIELLLRHAEADCQKEAICRALLLSEWTRKEQHEAVEALLQEVTDTVTKRLSYLIDSNILDAFRGELRDLFEYAMRFWRDAQYSTSKFDATVDDIEESGWRILSDLNNGGPAPESQTKFVILALFPRIFIVREEDDEVLFGGIGFWNWQTAAAAQKLRDDMEVRPLKRGVSRKERKMSNNGSGSAPTSPTKLKGAPFLARGRTEGVNGSG
jgi:hypothetical protein